jgi:hypothetical protein
MLKKTAAFRFTERFKNVYIHIGEARCDSEVVISAEIPKQNYVSVAFFSYKFEEDTTTNAPWF